MEVSNFFQFRGLSKTAKVVSKPLNRGRYLIGSIDTCDVQIQHESIKPIHAVLEIGESSHKIYRLDSDSSLLVNGEERDVSDLNLGDTLKVGGVVIDFDLFSGEKVPTLAQSSLDQKRSNVSSKTNSVITQKQVDAPYLIYPFQKDYNFDQSEYIFEDNQDIYPIFNYDLTHQAVEVIIIHKNRIFSVDYLPELEGTYSLKGLKDKVDQIEYPYLEKSHAVGFIESKGGSFFVNKLSDYSLNVFSNTKDKIQSSSLILEKDDIFSFQKGDISIVVRNVDPPPMVKTPPVLPRDKTLFMLLFLAFFFVSIPMYFIYNLKIDKEEIEKEKAPERIAKILYKRKTLMKIDKKKTPSKTKTPPKKVLKKKKVEVKKVVKKAPGPKVPVKTPPKKVAKGNPPKKVDNKKNPAPPSKNKAKKSASSKSASNKAPGPVGRKSKAPKTATTSPTPNSRGTVDVYKSNKFKSSISTLLAKGGQFRGAKTSGSSSGGGGGAGFTGTQGVSGGSGISTSTVSGKIGSPNGVKNGAQTFSAGAEGISGTKTFFTAGIPSETAVLGSMDPDLIRKILRDHIPQFRYCYQSELDRSNSKFSGAVKMTFKIGASGRVASSGVSGSQSIPAKTKSCINRVLKGIQFPKPLGGGVVEVSQPMNLYPKK